MESSQEENGKSTSSESVGNSVSQETVPIEKPMEPSIRNNASEGTKTEVVTQTPAKVAENSTAKVVEPQKATGAEGKSDPKNKRLDRSRKKNMINLEAFLKSLQPLSLQEQIDILTKRLNEMILENLTLNNSNKYYKIQTITLEKEKDQLRTEHNKTVMARTRLENVCRELQNNYKQIKEETAQKIRDEEEKRKEVTTKFQNTLADVSKMMEQNSSENIKLRNDNIQISDRFKKLCEEFKAREEDIQRISKQMSLEKKLSEANLARCQLELEAERCEKEVWLKEKETILRKLHDTTKDKLHMELSMKNMEENLANYSDKYSKFETTITKSNEIFEMYKGELAAMSQQVTKLEADCLTWKERWVQTSQAVNRLIGVNQSLENDLMISDKKLDQLASLCRFLQNERNCYLKQLKENNIKPEVVNTPEEKAAESSDNKATNVCHKEVKSPPLTAKERELQALRSEIVKLQTEINKAVEKEMEEKVKAKQQEMEKSKRRAQKKRGKKLMKHEERVNTENPNKSGQNSVKSNSPVTTVPVPVVQTKIFERKTNTEVFTPTVVKPAATTEKFIKSSSPVNSTAAVQPKASTSMEKDLGSTEN